MAPAFGFFSFLFSNVLGVIFCEKRLGKDHRIYWEKVYKIERCMIKIFRGGRVGDTSKTPSPLQTTFAFTHPLF